MGLDSLYDGISLFQGAIQMRPICPKCDSEQLDEGTDRKILCHNCKRFFILIGTWKPSEKLDTFNGN